MDGSLKVVLSVQGYLLHLMVLEHNLEVGYYNKLVVVVFDQQFIADNYLEFVVDEHILG